MQAGNFSPDILVSSFLTFLSVAFSRAKKDFCIIQGKNEQLGKFQIEKSKIKEQREKCF